MIASGASTDALVWLDEERARDAALVGAKLAKLAHLGARGHRIPLGFAIPAGAKRTPATELEGAIANGYAELGRRLGIAAPSVAVRSSTTVEDGDEYSHAGLFVSVLGVRGAPEVHRAVVRCHEAVDDSHSAYRSRFALGGPVEVAVGVVALVRARTSGVAFSRHPLASRRDRIVVESTFGYGPALVEGRVTPDRIELDRADLRVLRYDVASKAMCSTEGDDGIVSLSPMPDALVSAPSLEQSEAVAIAREVLAIEALLGCAVDVEWVVDESGSLTIVQARPITGVESTSPPTWDPTRYAIAYAFGGRR